jgi:phenylacetate-CoA ligase
MASIRQQVANLFYFMGKRDVLRYLDELNRLQWQSENEILAQQRRQLQDLLEYANTYVPYYREMFKEVGFHPSDFAADPTTFQRIPLLTKQMIRQNHDRLITTEEPKRSTLIRTKTGGTTGEPLWLMQEPAYRDYNTAHVYHKMTWSGWQVGQPQAWLWGHAVIGAGSQPSISGRIKDWLANRLESNAFYMTEKSLEMFATQIERNPGCVLWSYVSTMYRFAEFLQQRGHCIRAHAVYTAAEPLYGHQRKLIEEVLGCRVFDNYSCVEIGSIACECEQHNGLHITTRNCYVEVLQNGQPAPDGEEGEFVLTNLTNYGFPLIRYQIEDWGRKSTKPCPCGRGLPMLKIVEGRIIDHFKAKDGRLVWAAFLIPMVPTLGPIKQYQIVQKSVDLLIFRIVKAGPINKEIFKKIQEAVKTVLGDDVEAKLEFVDSLPLTPTGKHRYTICELE